MKVYFSEDPLPYKGQQDSYNFQKITAHLFKRVFKKRIKEIYDASKSYQGRPDDLREFLTSIRSYQQLLWELKKGSVTLSFCSYIFTIAGLTDTARLGKRNKARIKNLGIDGYKLYAFLRNYLEKEEKVRIISSLVFSEKIKDFPVPQKSIKHLMYRSMLFSHPTTIRKYYVDEYCFPNFNLENTVCECAKWLMSQPDPKVDEFLYRFVLHIYEMRNSIVHNGNYIPISHTTDRPPEVPASSWGMTILSSFSRGNRSRVGKYVEVFETSVHRDDLEQIFFNSLWRAFEDGFPNKKAL